MALHNETGKWGEQLACEYLMREGYRIVERDWKCGQRDLDIVAIENDVYVFAANAYVKGHRIDRVLRFDIITIVGTPDKYEIRHTKDAFLPFI